MSAPGLPDPSATLARHRRRVLVVTGIGAFMGPLDVTIVALGLPRIGDALSLSFSGAVWVQAAYLFTYALALLPAGRVADQWGRMRVWRLGVVVFAVASLVAGLATSSWWLIGARLVQGFGGAMLAATATALVTAAFPPGERGRALGLNVMSTYLGLSTGPLLGGVLVAALGWRSVFLVNVPVAVIGLAVARGLRDVPQHPGRPRIDVRSAVVLAAGLGGVMVGLSFAPLWGWTSARAVGLVLGGLVLLAAFTVLQSRGEDPLLDLAILRGNRVVAFGSAAALLNYTAMFGSISLTAVLLEIVGGRSPIHSGLIMVVQPLLMVVLSPFAGRLSDRIGSRLLATGGMVLVAAGLAVLAMVPADVPAAAVVPGMATVGVGMAMFSSPNVSAVMGGARGPQLGIVSALLATMRTLGQSLSLALLGGLAAVHLGAAGAAVVLLGKAEGAAHAGEYLAGYRVAMAAGAGIALVGALLSSARGPADVPAGRVEVAREV